MKIIPKSSYDKIFDALMSAGYTEEESEQLICDVIEDLKECDTVAEKLHKIVQENKEMRS